MQFLFGTSAIALLAVLSLATPVKLDQDSARLSRRDASLQKRTLTAAEQSYLDCVQEHETIVAIVLVGLSKHGREEKVDMNGLAEAEQECYDDASKIGPLRARWSLQHIKQVILQKKEALQEEFRAKAEGMPKNNNEQPGGDNKMPFSMNDVKNLPGMAVKSMMERFLHTGGNAKEKPSPARLGGKGGVGGTHLQLRPGGR